jgi:hypothetical protein
MKRGKKRMRPPPLLPKGISNASFLGRDADWGRMVEKICKEIKRQSKYVRSVQWGKMQFSKRKIAFSEE